MTLSTGTKHGRYEIRSKIGAGGMGEVYLAQDTKLDRKVALKLLPAELASNRDRMDRFVREAKSAAALDWSWKEAENQFKRALELDPNSADSHWFYATFLSSTGRSSESLNEIRRARELDPLNLIIGAGEGQLLIHGARADEALASLQKTTELDPNFWFAHMLASDAYAEKGMFTEAVAEARKATELSGANSHSLASLGYALARSGKQAEARAVLDELLKV